MTDQQINASQNSIPYTKTTFKNGLRLILVPMEQNQTVTAMVMVATGSDYESVEENGISHFLEHMCFKGTVKRPVSKLINSELDAIGSLSNAFTGNEYTGYYAKAHARHTEKVIDIISDLFLNSTLPKGEIEKERGVIIEEINMYEDRPDHKVGEVYDKLIYGDQPSGRPIIGPKENILKFSQQDFIDYRAKHYIAEKTVIVVAGHIDDQKVIQQVETLFKDISTNKAPVKVVNTIEQVEPRIALAEKKIDQTHLVLGFKGINRFDPDYWKANMLSTLLGRGMSSRLFQKMREELGICYYIGTYLDTGIDSGNFNIRAGVANERVEEAIKGIIEELKRVKNEPVSEEELRKIKDLKIGRMYLGLESSDDLADFYGFQELYNEPILSPEDETKKIEEVTAEDLKEMAEKFFVSSHSNLAIIGPHDEKLKVELMELLKNC